MKQSFFGALVGGGLVYGVVLLGKLMFGRQHVELAPGTKISFGETALRYGDTEVPYEEIFYRRFDTIAGDSPMRRPAADRLPAATTIANSA